MLWRVYKHTRNIEDYTNYKEALNLAITEIRKSKRTFEKKLAGNIKNDSKSFYAYVRSKQKVRYKVGPLENNSGNIISDGFQTAEVLNEYFSSVFTTEDISSLPVPFTIFEGKKSEHLMQLFVTAEMIAKKMSKEAIRKIAHKQMLWRVYKHTGNVEDYTNYKEAFNLATTEIRKSKRTF